MTLFAGKGESALMGIIRPDGSVCFEEDRLTNDIVRAVIAPEEAERGAAWCVEIAEAPEGVLEDYSLLLSDDLPPHLATTPEGLLVAE